MKNLIAQFVVCLLVLTAVQTNSYAAGVVDRGFGTIGTVVTAVGASAQARKVKIQTDGKILVLGGIGNGWQDMVLVRYNADGSLDTGFGTNGIVIKSFSTTAKSINDFALQSDGKIIVAGYFRSTATQSDDFLVARFNQDGSFDTSFGAGGIATVNQSSVDIFNTVIIQPDNKIIAAGTTSQNNYEFAAIRFNANGTLDTSFSNGGYFFYDLGLFRQSQEFRAAAVLPNGQILLGGTALDTGGGVAGIDVLIKLESNGAFAQNFGTGGIVNEFSPTYSPGFNYDLEVLPDGKIQTISARLFRRVLSNGTPDPGFRNRYYPYESTSNAGSALDVRSDGKILVLNQGEPGFTANAVLYNPDGRDINYARGVSGADIVVQNDDKFIIVSAAGDSLVLKRFIAISSTGTRLADFDYDEKTDLAVLRGGTNVVVFRSSQGVINYQLSRVPGDTVRIMPENYSTTNLSTLSYWRVTGQQQSRLGYFETIRENSSLESNFQWGTPGDLPVGGDYDGETLLNSIPRFRKPSEYAIFRPADGDWWIFNRRTNAYFTVHWGAAGDKPVPADYDYDGITDYAIYRPSTGTWWVHRSSNDSYFTLQFGNSSDTPLTGDFDGDGRADFTVYRASEGNWYQYLTTEGYRVVRFGLPADVPVPGDYDGDGKTDVAVFREGVWYLLQSSEGLKVVQWGAAGDIPAAIRYDQ